MIQPEIGLLLVQRDADVEQLGLGVVELLEHGLHFQIQIFDHLFEFQHAHAAVHTLSARRRENGPKLVLKLGATFLTVHAYPKTMAAALEGSRGSQLKILAVTILTSYNDDDVREAGFTGTVSEQVARRARKANELGIHGLVCSPEEAALVRPLVGSRLLVTPGIRPAGSAAGDQKRIMTPAKAMAAGADYLVVGRPITEASDPKAAADAIVAEISAAKAA